jgi:hypothetical protein
MNTDAAAPVAFAGGLDLTIPHSFAIGIGLLIGGIVLIVIAIVLIVLGARARPRPQSRPVPDPAAGALARPGRTGRRRAQELDIGDGTHEPACLRRSCDAGSPISSSGCHRLDRVWAIISARSGRR